MTTAREEHAWTSPALGRRMRLVRYGHWGKPLVLFPTATADHLDYERFGMIGALGPLMDRGLLKVYAVESVQRESWMDPQRRGEEAAAIQDAYNRYVTEELVPFVRQDCHTPGIRLGASGASLGCYQASNQVFRRPDLFDVLVGLSGRYDPVPWCRGEFGSACYLNSPLHFVGGLRGPLLRALKRDTSITMVSGRRGESPRPARAMARVLRRKRIRYQVDVWKQGRHDWAWWNRQLPRHLWRLAGEGRLG